MFPRRQFKCILLFCFPSCFFFSRKKCIPEILRKGTYTLMDRYTPTWCFEYKSLLDMTDLMPRSLSPHRSQYGFSFCSFFLLFVLVRPYFAAVFFYFFYFNLRSEDSEFPLAFVPNHTDPMSAFFPCEVFRSGPGECCLTPWSTHSTWSCVLYIMLLPVKVSGYQSLLAHGRHVHCKL